MITEIYNFISLNNKEFIRQSKLKLDWKWCEDKSSHIELVQTVLISFLEKINKDEIFLTKMYELLKQDRLFLYIIKSIDSNAKYPSAPYISAKRKMRKTKQLDINLPIILEELEEHSHLDKLINLLNIEEFTRMFGKSGFFYLNVFKKYSQPNETYKSVADYYKLSKSSITAAITTTKKKLLEELTQ